MELYGVNTEFLPDKVLSFCVIFQLAGVDVVAALDMYVERGEWQKCIETAEQQVKGLSGKACA